MIATALVGVGFAIYGWQHSPPLLLIGFLLCLIAFLAWALGSRYVEETHPGYLPEDVPRQFREPLPRWTADDERAALEEYARS